MKGESNVFGRMEDIWVTEDDKVILDNYLSQVLDSDDSLLGVYPTGSVYGELGFFEEEKARYLRTLLNCLLEQALADMY